MVKRWLVALGAALSLMVSGCSLMAADRSASSLEEWAETQTDFPGAEVLRRSSMFGTSGAAVHYVADSLAEAQRFAGAVREEIARIDPPGSSHFGGRVEWPLDGGTAGFHFPGLDEFDDALWELANSPLPAAATARRVGWSESPAAGQRSWESLDGYLIEYGSTDLLTTAEQAPAPDATRLAVRSGGQWLGPFPSDEMAPRASSLGALASAVGGMELRGDVVKLAADDDVLPAAEALSMFNWEITSDRFTALVGPGFDPPVDLIGWALADPEPVTVRSDEMGLRVYAPSDGACARFVGEAPDPHREFELTCPSRLFLTGTRDEVSRFHGPAMAAIEAGATQVSVADGTLRLTVPEEDPTLWPGATAAIREIGWSDSWQIRLTANASIYVDFRSTSSGRAGGRATTSASDPDIQAGNEQLIGAWDASAG